MAKQYLIVAKTNVEIISLGLMLQVGDEAIVDKENKEMRRAKKHGLIEYKEYTPKKPKPEKPAAKKPRKKPEAPKEEPSPEELPVKEFDPDKASTTMVRAKAKELGIVGYSSKKPVDLRKLVKEKLRG